MTIISSRPAAARVRTRWRKKGARSLADRAGVFGTNVWKISLEVFKRMEKEGFRFGSDRVVTDVLAEFIAFLVQLADRQVYDKLSELDRSTFVSEAVRHLATTMENNQRDLLGPGKYREPFIDLLNTRFAEYAEFAYSDGEPGYPCIRFFATKVADVMAGGDNKWVVEQMMDIEAPEMVRLARNLIEQTMEAGPPTPPPGRSD